MPHRSEVAELLSLAAGEILDVHVHRQRRACAAEILETIEKVVNEDALTRAAVRPGHVSKERCALMIRFGQVVSVEIEYQRDGNFHFYCKDLTLQGGGAQTVGSLRFDFDAVDQRFVTGEVDARIAPKPSEPLPQRSPEAKLVEYACEAAKELVRTSSSIAALKKQIIQGAVSSGRRNECAEYLTWRPPVERLSWSSV